MKVTLYVVRHAYSESLHKTLAAGLMQENLISVIAHKAQLV